MIITVQNLPLYMSMAARIIEWQKDDMIVEIKNKIIAGDVLEFLIPNSLEVILLRIYEFKNAMNDNITKAVNPGQNFKIRINANLFHLENKQKLKELLPAYTLIRKEKSLQESEKNRLKLHSQSHKLETQATNKKKYNEKKDKYISSISEDVAQTTTQTPRIGEAGCCGKGCNGCLIFWYDDKYIKARNILAQKKQGEML